MQVFGGTESQVFGNLSKLDEFYRNSHVRVSEGKNQEPNEDRSQQEHLFEVGATVNREPQFLNSDTEGILHGDWIWRIKFQSQYLKLLQARKRKCALQVGHSSAAKTSLRRSKDNKIVWTFITWRVTALLANFVNNLNKTFKLPKSIFTTFPTFHEKKENFELPNDLFQTSLIINNKVTEKDQLNCFLPHAW